MSPGDADVIATPRSSSRRPAPPATPPLALVDAARPPLVDEQRVLRAVDPAALAVQRGAHAERLATHSESLHDAQRPGVVGEGASDHPSYAEVLEAHPDQLRGRLERVPVALVRRMQTPADVRLGVARAVGDLALRPTRLQVQVE